MPEKYTSIIDTIVTVALTLVAIVIAVFAFLKKHYNFKRDLQRVDVRLDAVSDKVEHKMTVLVTKIEKNDLRIDELEKALPAAIAELRSFALANFTKYNEFRERIDELKHINTERFIELKSDTQEIKDTLKKMRDAEMEELKSELAKYRNE